MKVGHSEETSKPLGMLVRPSRAGGANPKIRLVLFAHSPVHHRVPLYRRIADDERIDFTAIFASSAGVRPTDAGYGRPVVWDRNITDGYKSHFLRRSSVNPAALDAQSFFVYRDLDVIRAILSLKPDVLWLWGYASLTHWLAAATQIARRSPILFGENQTLLHAGSRPLWKRAIKKIGLTLLFSRGVALYVGKENWRWFRHYGVAEDKGFYSPYGVDNERLRQAASNLTPIKPALREALGIRPDGGPVVLCVARLIEKKQPLFLLEAFRRVRTYRNCTLLIVGSGELESAMRATIYAEAIPDVIFAGFMNQSQIPRAYAASDILALPSKVNETWGIVVNEGMNFSLPVIVSDKVGSGRDLVIEGKNGFIVSSEDPAELADRLVTLVDSADLRSRFGKLSREIVEARSVDAAAAGLIEAVAAVVGPQRWADAVPTPAKT